MDEKTVYTFNDLVAAKVRAKQALDDFLACEQEKEAVEKRAEELKWEWKAKEAARWDAKEEVRKILDFLAAPESE